MPKKNKKRIKRLKTEPKRLSTKEWDFFSLSTSWKVETKNCIFPWRQFVIYIAGTPLVHPSLREILKLIKNNTYHSLWRIWKAVWLLPEKVYATSVNEFKSSSAKLLALSGVTKCLNSWKFVTVSYFNYLLLCKTYVQKVISQPLFTDSKWN